MLMQEENRKNVSSDSCGSGLNYSAMKAGIVNKVQAYISPKIFGGKNAPSPVSGLGVSSPADAFMLHNPSISRFGEDILIEWRTMD